MIGTFKGTFQTVYLNEICFFYISICICGVIYTGNIYGVNYPQNDINQIEKILTY